jgi:hypothetical protein
LCDTFFPLGEETIYTTTFSNVFGEPVPEGVWKLLQGTRSYLPIHRIKVFFIQQLFTSFPEAEDVLQFSYRGVIGGMGGGDCW